MEREAVCLLSATNVAKLWARTSAAIKRDAQSAKSVVCLKGRRDVASLMAQRQTWHYARSAVRSKALTSVARKKGAQNVGNAVYSKARPDVASSPRPKMSTVIIIQIPVVYLQFAINVVRSWVQASAARRRDAQNVRSVVSLKDRRDVASLMAQRQTWHYAKSAAKSRDRISAARKRVAKNARNVGCLRARPDAASFPRPRKKKIRRSNPLFIILTGRFAPTDNPTRQVVQVRCVPKPCFPSRTGHRLSGVGVVR
jgi:uncharacterized protein YerC|tara:strand:+ start:114 stop:878 length:765 start_codon:yes stop_codon:yes gene_type:complete